MALDVRHPVESAEGFRIGRACEPEAHDPRGARPEVLDGVGHHESAVTDDGDPVGDALHLGERVGRQQHRAAPHRGLADEALELGLHQGIESGGRLVEDQQFRGVCEREQQADLLPVAFRQLPDRAIHLDAEPGDQVVGHRRVVRAAARGRTMRGAAHRSCGRRASGRRAGIRPGRGSRRCRDVSRGRRARPIPTSGVGSRAASGSSSTSLRRWGPGSRRPHPARRGGRRHRCLEHSRIASSADGSRSLRAVTMVRSSLLRSRGAWRRSALRRG